MPGGRQEAVQPGGPRHEARERALALLYEAELKSIEPSEVLGTLPAAPDPFAAALVEGVGTRADAIDSLVAEASVGWEIDRMPVVDRTILRLATYELLEETATSVAVVIDEAVELAKQYSTDDSGAFVNGVLSEIARKVRG